ncbi:thioredoxin domain-containing protein [Rhodovarius lipocyclicus]|uniref:thioredoxin domain-containing protein n=1 Tax=Rhodovarius lipocyclicus TaxID=268410 RepID=UPI00135A43D9|nr:thioredoxin domain-containing protein [Rhodovarius lipocyclicus]
MAVTTRRSLLAAPALLAATPALAQDARLGERSAGPANAPMVVTEFFSLTCSHCANFHINVWPQVKRELVETGGIRMVWSDFPLDEIALRAAMVARSLPADRYEPFVSTLFATQNRWAFGGDPMQGLAQTAALAGMPRAQFDTVIADQALQRGILEARLNAQNRYSVRATPSFLFGSRMVAGGMTFEDFKANVQRG